MIRRLALLLLVLLPAACTPPPDPLAHLPPFARTPFAPFSRSAAIAIAEREWRAWGNRVDDSDPHAPQPPNPDKPERDQGLWQRVGEYWFLGQDATRPESAWTGRTDATGRVFPPQDDAAYAWSAAFISYVMRTAGAGARFPAAPDHAAYINAARRVSLGQPGAVPLSAQPADSYAPQPGDLICQGRAGAAAMRFADLPAPRFPSHCDIVTAVAPGQLTVIGGNVDDAVTLKHVPTTANGRLADATGVIDTRYPWFVVLRVLYDAS